MCKSLLLLRCVDVALKIDAHVGGGPAFAGLSAPNTVVVLFQIRNPGVAGFLNLRFGLAFGEAVTASYRRVRVVLSRAVDRVVVGSRLRGRVLCRCGAGQHQPSAKNDKRTFHLGSSRNCSVLVTAWDSIGSDRATAPIANKTYVREKEALFAVRIAINAVHSIRDIRVLGNFRQCVGDALGSKGV